MTHYLVALVMLIRFMGSCVVQLDAQETEDEFEAVDVARLAGLTKGTELYVLENTNHGKREYKLEDFFWTGSGDGPLEESDEESFWNTNTPTTIYETKTILSTVFIESPSTNFVNQTNIERPPKCIFNCEEPQTPTGNINPTPTYQINPFNASDEDDYFDADRQFWLLTVLKSDGRDPAVIDLKNSLAKLYKTAFQRQHEKHLGISNNRTKRALSQEDEPVNVYIHDILKYPGNGKEKIEVLYHVAVAGKPVSATTAASDMKLVSDEEVTKELGYPFYIKAEPYIKAKDPQSLTEAKKTWIFIGTSILVLIGLLLLVAFLILGCGKRKRATSSGIENRQQVFEEEPGHDNKGFVRGERQYKKKGQTDSPTYINFRHQPSNQTLKSGVVLRPGSVSSSSISGSSIDISPLLQPKIEPSHYSKKHFRPKAALNKTAPLKKQPILLESDGSTSPDTITLGNCDPGVVSPKSYLSMPSVKSFPRSSMPESLSKVLEPVSVHHLDMMDPSDYPGPSGIYEGTLTRHGSVGAVADPGVIGPVVWSMHRQRLNHGVSMDEGMEDMHIKSSVSRMRKRFHDLLDDTFSLFGSRRDSPVDMKPEPIEVKSHSANNSRLNGFDQTVRPRPKTSDARRAQASPKSEPPRGAWMSTAPSPLVRPVSAGPFLRPTTAPQINVERILAEGKLRPNDPAVPLIAAIKSELEKCSLPGSASDLQQ